MEIKRLFLIMTLLGGLLFCLSSCDKLGDDESDSGGTGGKPVEPDYKQSITISGDSMTFFKDSIRY